VGSVNSGHFLMGCEARTWYRLLRENRGAILPEKLPQAALLTAVSTLMAPMAGLERAVYRKRIDASPVTRGPVFVLGHWRSGTTYLQDMLSRDPRFGWFDPVSTVTFPYRLLLGKALTPAVKKGIAAGRPMDNVQYSLDLPMEETFALLTQTTHDIIHMIAFPARYENYLSGLFIADLSEEERSAWRRSYDYILRKLTFIHGGKPLVLKSPDNTGRVPELREMYPDARFINIHRDPYRTIRSTVHMFLTQMELLRLTAPPENLEETVEDTVIGIFSRMYRELFALAPSLPSDRYAEVAFTDFCRDPVGSLARIYGQLELPGFAQAEPRFRAYAESQKNYKKNRLEVSPRLIRKINAALGFYFEHYCYDMAEAVEV